MAGRRRTLAAFGLPESLWRVARAPWGGLYLADDQGRDVLRDPDPVRRLEAYHLAKQAPALVRAMEPLIHRIEYLRREHHCDRDSTDTALQNAWVAVWDRRVPDLERQRAEQNRMQTELLFDREHDDEGAA